VGNGIKTIPTGLCHPTLIEATQKMKLQNLQKELFGEIFVDHFTQTREWEWRQH
jgi:glutamine synthetase